MFPQGNEPGPFAGWARRGLHSFVQLFHTESWCPKTFQELRGNSGLPSGKILPYYQVTIYWKSWGRDPKVFFERSFLDLLLISGNYSISAVYLRAQQRFGNSLKDSNVGKWGQDFQQPDKVDSLLDGYNKS